MTSGGWDRVEQLFQRAIERPAAERRDREFMDVRRGLGAVDRRRHLGAREGPQMLVEVEVTAKIKR